MSLRDLDNRVVPAAAQRVGALAEGFVVRRQRLGQWWRGIDLSRLKELDARYVGSGPLALLRDVPQVGFVVIGLVFLAGAGTAVSREAAKNKLAQQQVIAPSTTTGSQVPSVAHGSSTLGPSEGDTVPHYLTVAARGLMAAGTSAPDTARIALLSFSAYQTPLQVQTLLSGHHVLRVFLRAEVGGKDAAQLAADVKGDLAGSLTTAYAQAARGRLDAQKAYQGYVDTLTVTTKEDRAFKDLYAAFARSTGLEVKAYQQQCACVYAAVVSDSPSSLLQLRSRAGVRAIEVAAKGLTLQVIQLLPLLPEVTGVVPKQQVAVNQP
ncbi:MAG: hypothetical protein JWM02_2808 [Frankiales bacterium]|nr:hypothetical protein [Frankiales bacterium]